MYFGEMNHITRAIPLFKGTRGRHVTVLQSTSNHDHSRSQGINVCSALSRNYRVAQDPPVSYLTVKSVFMSDHSFEELRLDIFDSIENLYNNRLPHGSLAYKTPNEFEADFFNRFASV